MAYRPPGFLQAVVVAALLTTLPLFPGPIAGDWRIVPGIALKQEYTDNVFFDSDGAVRDWITTASPTVDIGRTTETTSAQLTARLDTIGYAENSGLNRQNHNLGAQLASHLSERLSLTAAAVYGIDSTPERDFDITGLLLGNNERRRQSYSGGASYTLSPLTTGSFNVNYGEDDFDDPDSFDTGSWGVGLGFSRRLDAWLPLTTGRLSLRHGQTDYVNQRAVVTSDFFGIGTVRTDTDQDVHSESTSAAIGFDRQWTERMSISLELGTNFSSTTETVSQVQRHSVLTFLDRPPTTLSSTSRRWAALGNATATLTLSPYQTATASVSHDIVPSSGTAGDTTRTGITLGLTHRFTDRLSASIDTGVTFNQTQAERLGADETDQISFRLQPRLRYEWRPHWHFEAGYNYYNNRDRQASTTAERNSLYLTINWRHDIFD
jgi:hypothetical protein